MSVLPEGFQILVHRRAVAKPIGLSILAYVVGAVAVLALWTVPDFALGQAPAFRTAMMGVISAVFIVWAIVGWAYALRFVFGGPGFYVKQGRLIFLHPLYFSARTSEIQAISLAQSGFWNTTINLERRGQGAAKLPTYLMGSPEEVEAALGLRGKPV